MIFVLPEYQGSRTGTALIIRGPVRLKSIMAKAMCLLVEPRTLSATLPGSVFFGAGEGIEIGSQGGGSVQ
jgi:hypothetical protein